MSSTEPEALAKLLRARAAAGPLRMEVSGSSMGRTIVSGSAVWIVGAERPRWGEVWAFSEPAGQIAVHRCVGQHRGSPRFWGDANPMPDQQPSSECLIGRVIRVEPPSGRPRSMGVLDQLGRSGLLWLRRLPGRTFRRLRA